MSIEVSKTEDQREPSDDVVRYRCPFCKAEYENELLARIHITRASDDAHRNYDGLMPETTVEGLDEDGTVVERIQRRPNELDTHSLTPAAFPDEFDERKKRVLLVAAYNPHVETLTELHERANAVLEERDIDSVSYATTRRWIHEFYLPHQLSEDTAAGGEATSDDKNGERETLDDLTAKQKAVVVHHVNDPEASDGEIAERVGCARSYPYHVYKRTDDVIERLEAKLEAGYSLEDILVDELEPESLEHLDEEGYLDGLDVDVERGRETDDDSDRDPEEPPTVSSRRRTDSPTTGVDARVMSASPTDALFSDTSTQEIEEAAVESSVIETTGAETGPADPARTDAESVSQESAVDESPRRSERSEDPEEQASSSAERITTEGRREGEASTRREDVVPKSDLEAVTARIRFLRRVFEREVEVAAGEPNERAQIQLALTQEVESELESLLRPESE